MIYVYPRLSRFDTGFFRISGPGLGNLLFPWARATIFAQKHGLPIIQPSWPQVKLKTLFDNTADRRLYTGLFNPGKDYIIDLKRLSTLALLPHSTEDDRNTVLANGKQNRIIDFMGNRGLFNGIKGHNDLVRRELLAIVKEEHLTGMRHDFNNSMTIHIRRGDFAVEQFAGQYKTGKGNLRVPLDWYVRLVQDVRSVLGQSMRVFVFSDGTDEELADLLSMKDVIRLDFGSSIADMLALSSSKLLVASCSSFSTWASYLGRMPTIWPTGQRLYSVNSQDPAKEFEYDGEVQELEAYLARQTELVAL
ncbi:MAG: hypothetical protein F6K39_02015 [Okeania sp. SIO3B3]|nr:hypothetical protein [Okeania sp. SIO3B3]